MQEDQSIPEQYAPLEAKFDATLNTAIQAAVSDPGCRGQFPVPSTSVQTEITEANIADPVHLATAVPGEEAIDAHEPMGVRNALTLTDTGTKSPRYQDIRAALDACDAYTKGQSLFAVMDEQRNRLLELTYEVYLPSRHLSVAELKQLLGDDCCKGRQRALQQRNTALPVIYRTTGATSEEDRKRCSDLAAVLLYAEAEKVSAADFGNWVAGKTLRECKTFMAQMRRGKQPALPKEATQDLQIEFRVGGRLLGQFPIPYWQELGELAPPLHTDRPTPLSEVLLAIAGHFDKLNLYKSATIGTQLAIATD